jgi:hypothetical protein
MKTNFKSKTVDQLGITASLACAIHCAALPFLITTLPLLGLDFLANKWIEIVMISIGHYFLENLEAILIPLGGLTIAAAHFLNWKYSKICQHK